MPDRDDESEITDLEQDFAFPVDFNSTTGNIEEISYNRVTESLFVYFHNGRYVYHDVPVGVVMGLANANSATRYLNAFVKGFFSYESF
jgi:hypothetical protein